MGAMGCIAPVPCSAPSDGCAGVPEQVQAERDELYRKFTQAIGEVQQKTGFKNLLLERKLQALTGLVEKKEVQLNEVLSAANLDPSALSLVTRKLEVPSGGRARLAGCSAVAVATTAEEGRKRGLWGLRVLAWLQRMRRQGAGPLGAFPLNPGDYHG